MTTVQTLIDAGLFALKEPGNASLEIAKVFCCDLLSIAMSKAPENGAWVTVMGNKNTLAVASLADVSCIILAEGITFSDEDLACAKKERIASLRRNFRSLTLRLRFRSCCHDSPVL